MATNSSLDLAITMNNPLQDPLVKIIIVLAILVGLSVIALVGSILYSGTNRSQRKRHPRTERRSASKEAADPELQATASTASTVSQVTTSFAPLIRAPCLAVSGTVQRGECDYERSNASERSSSLSRFVGIQDAPQTEAQLAGSGRDNFIDSVANSAPPETTPLVTLLRLETQGLPIFSGEASPRSKPPISPTHPRPTRFKEDTR